MTRIDRRTFIGAGLTAACALHPFGTAVAQTNSLQDGGGLAASTPTATIFTVLGVSVLILSRSLRVSVPKNAG